MSKPPGRGKSPNGGNFKRDALKAAVPLERLEAMRIAVIRHRDGDPLTFDMAWEIEGALEVLRQYFVKKLRHGRAMNPKTREQLQCAALAQHLIEIWGYSQQDAVIAAFPNPSGTDVESLAKTYRNLVPKICDPYRDWNPGVRVANIVEAQERYKKLNGGKLPKRRKAKT